MVAEARHGCSTKKTVQSSMTTERTFYTDGSASPNPGPGGYAVIENGQPVALGSEDGDTTNIRMEGSALIAAMKLAGGRPMPDIYR